jgi:hypothetical protein
MWNRAACNSRKAFVRTGPHTPVPGFGRSVLDEALPAQLKLGDQRAVLQTP